MQDFGLALQSGGRLLFRDISPENGFRLDRFAALTGAAVDGSSGGEQPDVILAIGQEPPPGGICLGVWEREIRLYWLPEQGIFRLQIKNPLSPDEISRRQVRCWQLVAIGAVIAAILRGRKILLVHGALLDAPRGAILLCGQSGMGKSTTSRRWRESGGAVYADDMMLLEFADRTIITHPLPTWSRCLESLEGEFFPFSRAVPLTRVIALARGSEEELKAVPRNEFLASLYNACIFFSAWIGKRMPDEARKTLVGAIQSRTLEMMQIFPPTGLFANLEAELGETLREFR